MNFPRENSYLTFSGSRWIQPGLRTRKRHLHALKSLFIARAREKPGPPRFFQTDPAPLPPPPLAQWPTVSKGILNWEKKKKKHEGFKRPRRRAFHWGDIEFSRVWRGGDLPSIMIRPSFPHDLPATGFEGATEVGPAWWIITCGILSSVFRWDVSMKVSPLVSQLRRGGSEEEGWGGECFVELAIRGGLCWRRDKVWYYWWMGLSVSWTVDLNEFEFLF